MIESGEVLGRMIIGKANPLNELDTGAQIQLFEPDFLDTTKTQGKGKGTVVSGIAFDAKGKRTGYWMRSRHPGAASSTGAQAQESKLIPADEMVHLFEQQRTQTRGVPWLAPVMKATFRCVMACPFAP